jgi:CRISPR/Cas system CMR subunit Cmr4 (Cas7 group RAMP superfamily)
MYTHVIYAKFLHKWKLHIKGSQLQHRVECAEHIFESVLGKNVAVTVNLFRSAAEVQFGQLLYSTQLIDSFIGDATVVWVTCYLLMRKLANDLEPQTPVQRLSSELQCSTDSLLSCGNAASHSPISTHSFDWQLTKETAVTVEKTLVKSEAIIVRSLNSTDDNGEPQPQRMAAEWFSTLIK